MSRFIPIASTIFYFLYISDIIVRIKYDWILESLLQDEFSREIPRNRGIPRKITMSGKRSEMVDGVTEDLQADQEYGSLRVINPFHVAPASLAD